MKNIVLISHGPMAAGVKASLEMIIGQQDNIHVVSLRPDGDNIQFETELTDKIKTLTGSTLIIADLLGGTPSNVSLKNYHDHPDIGIIAGLSLPLVIEAATNYSASLDSLIATAKESSVDVKALMSETPILTENITRDLSSYADFAGQATLVNVRIDERLIHGQVAGIWSTSLNTQRLIVANDDAATDPLQKSSLRMAAPSSMRLSVLTVQDAAHNIASGKYGKQRLFLLFKNPTDVLQYLQAGGQLKKVTVGNMSYKEGSREITKSIKVMPTEEQIFIDIANYGVGLTAQLVPDDSAIDFIKKLTSN